MKKNIRKLSESFLHAFRGLRLCIHDERNFRVHMTAAFYVILFGVFGGVSMTEAAILCICFGLTMGAELLNTAIERLCDKTVVRPGESREHKRSVAMDKVLTGKYTALPCFIGIMALVF